MLAFVRAADKFVQEWNSDQRDRVLAIWLQDMPVKGVPDEALAGIAGSLRKRAARFGYDSSEFARKANRFCDVYDDYRRRYSLEIENQHLKNLLELVHPILADRARGRGLSPRNPLMLSATVEKILKGGDPQSLKELRRYRRLADLWERHYRLGLKEGAERRRKKVFARIKKLRTIILRGKEIGKPTVI